MSKRVNNTQLGVVWSRKENDFIIHFPMGSGSKSDGHWLSGVFNKEFEEELKSRGYDPKTLKFTVDIDFDGPRAEQKFATLTAGLRQN